MGIKKQYIKDGVIRTFYIVGDKVSAMLLIGGQWVCNPTVERLEQAGWAPYTPPTPPTPEPVLPTVEELVERKLRERYSINQEFEVNRKRDSDPTAFAAYYDYVEECIAWANEQPHREEAGNE